MLTAVGYGRVSLIEQGQEEHFSLPHQQEHIRQECAARGWKLVAYFEDMESGKSTDKRTGFKEAMKAMKHADVLVVHELDRLSRNLIDTLMIADELHKQGKKFVSIHDNIDSSNDQGELQMHILAVFAHYFRKQLARKVHGGMSESAKAGEWNGRAPYGYRVKNKKLIIEESEASVVKSVFDMYLNKNISMRAIAHYLNSSGVKTLYGGYWTQVHIRKMLTKRTYVGDTVWNMAKLGKSSMTNPESEWIITENTHEPIINRQTFKATQERIATKKDLGGRVQKSQYLLSGVLYCGKCGGKMFGRRIHSGKINVRMLTYYVCSAYLKSGTCEQKNVRTDLVDGLVKSAIEHFLGSKEDVGKLISKYKNKILTTDDKRNELNNLKKMLNRIPERKDKQLEAYELGEITFEEFKAARYRLDKQQKEIKDKIESLEKELKEINEDELKRLKLSSYWEIFNQRDVIKQKAWVQEHIKRVVFKNGQVHIDFTG